MDISSKLKHKIDQKTKPLGSLGKLETLAYQMGEILQTDSPNIENPHLLVFAADHGLAQEGVSAYPSKVTEQMVYNFLSGGAAINVFCRQHEIPLTIIDAGILGTISTENSSFLSMKAGDGTKSSLQQSAMSNDQLQYCMGIGKALVKQLIVKEKTLLLLGEMGIGNTASAALILHLMTHLPLADCVGKGTGLNEEGLAHKRFILSQVATRVSPISKPLDILREVGGFEIAMMVGSLLALEDQKMLCLVDGFIVTAAAILACAIQPKIKAHLIFAHTSDELAHKAMLSHLEVDALLNLNLRLGEGTGAALAYPLLVSACRFMNEMATFESAQVSEAKN